MIGKGHNGGKEGGLWGCHAPSVSLADNSLFLDMSGGLTTVIL